MFKEIKKHMHEHVENPAEKFKPTKEDEFPNLTAQYWANPNDQRGHIVTCCGASGKDVEYKRSEGI